MLMFIPSVSVLSAKTMTLKLFSFLLELIIIVSVSVLEFPFLSKRKSIHINVPKKKEDAF